MIATAFGLAMTEAIHWPPHNDMDCHGAVRLAMTQGDVRALP
jgi:hypothetical protein